MTAEARSGTPWVLPALFGLSLLMVGLLGVPGFVAVMAGGLQLVFLLFFLRHLAFVASAARTAPVMSGGWFGLAAPVAPAATEYDTDLFDHMPRLSVLVACHNEERVVDRLVGALRDLDYPADRLQLTIVDDGSTDRTAELLDRHAAGQPLLVLHRPPRFGGGKSGALNYALPYLTGEVVVVFDADHRPRPDVLRRLARHFADPCVGAVQGHCRVLNSDTTLIATLVGIDYLAGYLVNEFGRQVVFRLPAYGGANCAVRTASLRRAGGWNEGTVTEDTDLTLRLVLSGQRVRYDITAVDEEEAVTTLRRYWTQRYRWARGHQQVWRDFRRVVWRSPRLSPLEKLETTMFLLVFHVPVFAALGVVVLVANAAGLTPMNSPPVGNWTAMFWTLLLLGPMLELGTGVMLGGASRRRAVMLLFFLPLFFISMVLCAKAWVDGVLGRPYTWAKTTRTGDQQPGRPPAGNGTAR